MNLLLKIGIDVSFEDLKEKINNIIESKDNLIETIDTGTYSYLTLSALTFITEGEPEKVVCMTLRGERK